MTKVVIMSASRNIGIALINYCLRNGDEIIVLARPDSLTNNLIPKDDRVTVVEADLTKLDHFKTELKGDIFYHLGWNGVKRELRNDPFVQLSNVEYTLNAVRLASIMGCKKFIGVGSQAEYGPKNEMITEDTSVNPTIGYGIAKYTAGKLSKILCEQLGIEYNWARVFSVFGPNDASDNMIMMSINMMINNEEINYSVANQLWEYIYADDCAKALYLIGKNGINGKVYNISTGEAMPLRDYILKIKSILNSKSQLNFGAISTQGPLINLHTDISELKTDTGFFVEHSFEEGIRLILSNKK